MQEDITRQRIIEEGLRQTEKLSMMGTMVAEVTHEILNPLTVIKIYAELMEGEEVRKEIKESLRVIIDQVRKAVRITDGLKTFSRPKNRTISLINIQETFDKTIFLIENDLKSGNISLERKFLQDIPLIYADEDKLFQVFLNLLKNSKEAIVENRTKKENRISVEAGVEGDWLAVTVSDDGPGMASHILQRIFDPFFTTKEIGKGTGLGLSVVKSIMAEHHGTIRVQSTEGNGTTFVLHFPLTRTGP